MNFCLRLAALLLFALLLSGGSLLAQQPTDRASVLFENDPAEHWVEAYPIGNGRLGAMVFGGVGQERLALNEDTLWSGFPRDSNNPGAKEALVEVRRLLFAGDLPKAQRACMQMQGHFTQSYLPFGDLSLVFEHDGEARDYRRTLDLAQGVAAVQYSIGETLYRREMFVSHIDQALVIRLTAEGPGSIRVRAHLDTPLRAECTADGGAALILRGVAPSHVEPEYRKQEKRPIIYNEPEGEGMRFVGRLAARGETGFSSRVDDGHLVVTADQSVTLLFTAATSYNGYARSPGLEGKDPERLSRDTIERLSKRSDADLHRAHLEDHGALFGRVGLDLGPGNGDVPTSKRIAAYEPKRDPDLVRLLFQFGRYLLIASSREGSQPANLQGIWNEDVRPAWSSNYTLNINAEMNYWLAESTNLAECALPVLDFAEGLAVRGSVTARTNYGCGGWVAHHNSDLWRSSNPVGDFGRGHPCWANWCFGGVWMCEPVWEHYAFSGDVGYLRQSAYPLMRGAAEFMLDYLVEDPRDFYPEGTLVTAPSTSAENLFEIEGGERLAVHVMATQDIVLLRELFDRCLLAARVLGVSDSFTQRVAEARVKLPPLPIGDDGRLMEYALPFAEPDPHHRHISHLIGLYPGDQVSPLDTPELADAVRRSLEVRTDAGTGWSMAWKVNCWARLLDGNRALSVLGNMLKLVPPDTGAWRGGGVYPNLFDAHPPFQIDGNFGVTAGIAEMLLHSHRGELHLLPALPDAWPTGRVRGLRARGGYEVDIVWSEGRLLEATIQAGQSGGLQVRYADRVETWDASPGERYVFRG